MEELNKIKSALDEFIRTFQRNPFEFLYESDVKACLSCILHKKFSSGNDQISMETTKSGLKFFCGKSVTFSPVKTEYPSKERVLSIFTKSFDIAVIDKRKIDDNTHLRNIEERRNELFWNRKVKVAIEIKYCQLGDGFREKLRGIESDAAKIERYSTEVRNDNKLIGLALLFVQPRKEDIEQKLDGYRWKKLSPPNVLKENVTRLIITESELLEISPK
jgi:hypothetical protein